MGNPHGRCHPLCYVSAGEPTRTTTNNTKSLIMYNSLDGTSAVVTGAASGIGREIAKQLSDEGSHVVGLDLSADPHDDGPQFADVVDSGVVVEGDVRDLDAVDEAFEVAESHAPVTVAVNNAGIPSQGTVEDLTPDDMERAFGVHVLGAFNVCKRAISEMIEVEAGSIVNMSSVTAQLGWQASADYSPMKGALSSFTRQLAADYSRYGIRVNAIAPGVIKTAMTTDIWDEDRETESPDEMGAKVSERVDREVAMRRTLLPALGEPADVANLATFLASEQAGFITGQTISVDGGWSISSI